MFDALAPSLGEIWATDFVGHALEVSLSDEKNPAIVGVNLNGAPQLSILIFELWIFLNFCSAEIDFGNFFEFWILQGKSHEKCGCVYRKPKSERSDDEAHRGSLVT